MPIVNIPGVGRVNFPADMPLDQVERRTRQFSGFGGEESVNAEDEAWLQRAGRRADTMFEMAAQRRKGERLTAFSEGPVMGGLLEGLQKLSPITPEGRLNIPARDVRTPLQAGAQALDIVTAPLQPGKTFLADVVAPVSRYLGGLGEGAARDIRLRGFPSARGSFGEALAGKDIGPSPGGPVGRGIDMAGGMAGELAPALVAPQATLGRLTVPEAFASQAAGQSLSQTGGEVAPAVLAGATAYVIPAVGHAGRAAAANVLGKAVSAGLLGASRNTIQKGAEILASQGAMQTFMAGMSLPDYVAATPERRKEMLIENTIGNSAFLLMDLPVLASRGTPSETYRGLPPAAKVGHALAEVINDPKRLEAFRDAADSYARDVLGPDFARYVALPQRFPTQLDTSRGALRGSDEDLARRILDVRRATEFVEPLPSALEYAGGEMGPGPAAPPLPEMTRGVTRPGIQPAPAEVVEPIRPAPAISEPVPAPAAGRAMPEATPESTTTERGHYKETSGKTVLVMSKAEYDALEPTLRDNIRRYFNWSPNRRAFISKASKDDYWARNIVREAGLPEMEARPAPEKKPGPAAEATEGEKAAQAALEWKPPLTDKEGIERDRADVKATEAEWKKLQVEYGRADVLKRELEKRVVRQTGPRYQRGQMKASAKAGDVAAYNKQREILSNLDTAMRVLQDRIKDASRRVRAADLADIANDPSNSTLRRLGAQVGSLYELGLDVPNAMLTALTEASHKELVRRFPDITPEESKRMVSEVSSEAMRGATEEQIDSAFRLNPSLQLTAQRASQAALAVEQEAGRVAAERAAVEAKAAAQEAERLAIQEREDEAQARQMMADAAAEMEKAGTTRRASAIKDELVQKLAAAVKAAPEPGSDTPAPRRIIIAVPGDGVFMLLNNKVTLEGTLKRARALSTAAGGAVGPAGPIKAVQVPKLGAKLSAAEVIKELKEAFASEDDSRPGITDVYAEGGRAIATDGRTVIEVRGSFVAKDNPDTPFPVRATDKVRRTAQAGKETPVSIATDDLFRISRLTKHLDFKDEPWVDLYADEKSRIYGETLDAQKDAASYGVPTTHRYLGRYNADSLQSLVRFARKSGDATVTLAPSKWMETRARMEKAPNATGPGKEVREDVEARAGIFSGDSWEAVSMRFNIEAPQAESQPPPAEGGINTGALGEVGMGGAKPGEFAPGRGTPTAIKNAQVDIERRQHGLPPAMEPMRRTFGMVWDEAMATVDRAPEAQDALITELQAKPRAVTDLEDALLLHRQVDLQNEYARNARELAAAYDDARRFPDRLEAVERHKLLLNETSNRLNELYDINKAVGTATARGLVARKMLANEDFTLAKMEMEMRAAKDGRPLSDGERQELQRAHDRIADLQRRHDEALARADAAESARAADAAVRDLQARAAAAEPVFTPEIKSLAERIVTRLESEATAARARLREKFARTSAGVDPTILYDLSVIGAAKIARGILNKMQFVASLIEEFGEGVREYGDAAWDAANAKIDREVGRMAGAKAPEVRDAVRRADPTAQRQNIVEGMTKAAQEGVPLQELGEYVRRLALNLVRSGVNTRDALIDAVHAELVKIAPGVTRRQAMDAISGYGDFRPLDPNQFKAKLRDLKGQMQQVAKLEDIQSRQAPLKTGVERRAPSDEERRLIAQVNEAKRRYGVVTTDPARQLASALDSIKTRLRNQISDLEHQIATHQPIVKDRTKTPYDAEAELLKTRRDALQTQFETIFPRAGITEAQRVVMAERAIERDIAEYEKRIAAGDIGPLRGRERQLRGVKLDALRTRRDALRDELASLRAAAKADPAAQLADLKARMAARLADYQERIARGDFTVNRRPTVHLDNHALRIRAELEIAKGHWRRGVELAALRERTLPHRILGGIREALNLPRAVLASWDVSAVLRQGGFIALGHPLRAARALGPMFRALASERQAVMVDQQIAARPNAPLYHRAKLYLAPLETTRLTSMEEAFMSRLASRVPGVGFSQRAFVTFLNKLRADSFDAMVDGMQRRGAELNQAELQAVANYINIATGRGDLGRAAAAAETLATAFFAPRLVASRFQLLAGKPFYDGSGRTRRAVAMEYARFLSGLAVLYGLANLVGADIETDPRSSDFGKLLFGNTRVDPLAGLNQVSVLTARLVSGERLTSEGQVKPLRGAVPYGQDTSADVIARFLRSKLSPVVGASVDVLSGENVIGEPTTAGGTAVRLLAPLSFQDIYQVMQADGLPKGAALGILSVFGMGLQQQDDPASRKMIGDVMKRVRGGTPEQREEIRRQLKQSFKGR